MVESSPEYYSYFAAGDGYAMSGVPIIIPKVFKQ